MIAGFFVIAVGIVLSVRAGLGPGPWDVFHVGVSGATGIPLGRTITYVGLVVIALGLLIRVKPTLCTVLNMLLIGQFVDLVAAFLPLDTPATLAGRLVMLCGGIVVQGLGEGLYLGTRVGAGPRDGFMLGIVKLTGKRIWVVQTAIEVTLVMLGYALGSPPGAGTLIFAVSVGYFIEFFLNLLTPVISRLTAHLVDQQRAPAGADS